jgi:hypothetical protein
VNLNVLRRKSPRRVVLSSIDRLLYIRVYRKACHRHYTTLINLLARFPFSTSSTAGVDRLW